MIIDTLLFVFILILPQQAWSTATQPDSDILHVDNESTGFQVTSNKADFQILFNGDVWLQSSQLNETKVYCNKAWQTPRLDSYFRHSVSDTPSTDSLTGKKNIGDTQSQQIEWHWKVCGARWLNIVKVFEKSVIFEQVFPQGLNGTAYREVHAGKTDYRDNSYTVTGTPFPSFVRETTENIGYFTLWSTFTHQRPTGKGLPPASKLGLSGGPVVLFNEKNTAILVTTRIQNFKNALQSTDNQTKKLWVMGLSGELESIPKGTRHSSIIHTAGARRGITATYDSFGRLFRRLYGIKKADDLVTSKLGYWTDNGAYFYAKAYNIKTPPETALAYNLTCCSEELLLRTVRELQVNEINVQYLQLDAWWYVGKSPQKNWRGAKVVKDWEMPDGEAYPGGLLQFADKLDLPLLLYGPYFAPDNLYSNKFAFVPFNNVTDAVIPAPNDSFAFYDELFHYGKRKTRGRMFSYEVDFMNLLYLGIPEFRRHFGWAMQWLHGMNRAGQKHNITIQYCMAQASDIMASVAMSQVTNGRASFDYPVNVNWDITLSSLFFWAVGLQPSKDTFWTTDGETADDSNYVKTSNEGRDCELNAVIATFSLGPVGISDGPGKTNYTRIAQCCSLDGTILQPDKPMTVIDNYFLGFIDSSKVIPGTDARIQTSYSSPMKQGQGEDGFKLIYHYVLAANVNAKYSVWRQDLFPVPSALHYFVRNYHDGRCTSGDVASSCMTMRGQGEYLLQASNGILFQNGLKGMQLFTIYPVHGCRLVLLGEMDKFVAVSRKRFLFVDATCDELVLKVRGSAGERVQIGYLKKRERDERWIYHSKQLLFHNTTEQSVVYK